MIALGFLVLGLAVVVCAVGWTESADVARHYERLYHDADMRLMQSFVNRQRDLETLSTVLETDGVDAVCVGARMLNANRNVT